MQDRQLPLFPPRGTQAVARQPVPPQSAPLTASSSLNAAIGAFFSHMRQQGLSPHTIQAFTSDLRLLAKYIGANMRLEEISEQVLQGFLNWLRYERGVPCKPKSYQRRLTTLKVFFSWLAQMQVIPMDPAAPIAHQPVSSPLPQIVYPEQVTRLVAAARDLMEPPKSDPRPHLLVTLLLTTGIKKSETMAIRLSDIDLSRPSEPVLYIRYENARQRHKERKLKLPPDFADCLRKYRQQYQVRERLFECTARNLEYVLAELAHITGLGETVSFESLRWTCAVQDFQNGTPEDQIRQKMGLATITWEDAGDKLRRLAAKPL